MLILALSRSLPPLPPFSLSCHCSPRFALNSGARSDPEIHPGGLPAIVGTPYVIGKPSTNTCPSSAHAITTAEACRSAAEALGKAWRRAGSFPESPSGCLDESSGGSRGMFYNEHLTGSNHVDQAPVCGVCFVFLSVFSFTANVSLLPPPLSLSLAPSRSLSLCTAHHRPVF